jgi:hypothetical protein
VSASRVANPGDTHSQVAGPNGVTLLYPDGLVIQLRLIRGCWSAIVADPHSVRKADRVSENGDWL